LKKLDIGIKPICGKLPQASGRHKNRREKANKEAGMTRTGDYMPADRPETRNADVYAAGSRGNTSNALTVSTAVY
jgi:hypothetical protein